MIPLRVMSAAVAALVPLTSIQNAEAPADADVP